MEVHSNSNGEGQQAAGGHGRRRGAGCMNYVLPILNLLCFFANFVPADVGTASRWNDTALTPPPFAFLLWLVIYAGEFLFVCYQLCSPRIRESSLIQSRISFLWIFHQILIAVWLVIIAKDHIITSAIVSLLLFVLSLLIFLLITYTFRTCLHEDYQTKDFILIEIPFALLLGWETVAALISLNTVPVKLFRDGMISPSTNIALQFSFVTTSFALIAVAGVLYAGLSSLINPFLHIPLLWGLGSVAYRWGSGDGVFLESDQDAGKWATEPILQGVRIAALIDFCVVALFFVVAVGIMFSTRFFIAPSAAADARRRDDADAQRAHTDHQSPLTARSNITIENRV